jgi:hypothetical protein
MSRKDEQAWRDIIDNFGDRADLGDGGPVELPEFDEHEEPSVEPDPESWHPSWEDEGHFEPPTAPPLPRTTPARAIAWFGVLAMPAIAILLYTLTTIFAFDVPKWLAFLMVAGFVGGFGYLVATMGNDPGDGWDDGARL